MTGNQSSNVMFALAVTNYSSEVAWREWTVSSEPKNDDIKSCWIMCMHSFSVNPLICS